MPTCAPLPHLFPASLPQLICAIFGLTAFLEGLRVCIMPLAEASAPGGMGAVASCTGLPAPVAPCSSPATIACPPLQLLGSELPKKLHVVFVLMIAFFLGVLVTCERAAMGGAAVVAGLWWW